MTLKTRAQRKHKQSKNLSSRASEPEVQTFTYHIRELRTRLFWSLAVGVVAGTLVYNYNSYFIDIVMAPLGDQKLIYLTPAGGFSFIFMVTFYVTMIIILPFILYQIYAFLKPAIPKHTGKLSLLVAASAMILMVAGATFGYIYAVPAGLNFLSNFANNYVVPSITADSYLSFVLGYVLGIGFLFELPLLLFFWHWIHPLTPKGLLNSERYVIVGAFIAAAVLSPSPDALSQTVIAVPIVIIYQLGVVGVLISVRRERKRQKAAQKQTVAADAQPAVQAQFVAAPVQVKPAASLSSVLPVQPIRRKVAPMDGFLKTSPKMQSTRAVVSPNLSIKTQRPVPQLQVMPRNRVISDFRPNRNSVVDMGR
jgi:sec-independent protein translocase protein TatC